MSNCCQFLAGLCAPAVCALHRLSDHEVVEVDREQLEDEAEMAAAVEALDHSQQVMLVLGVEFVVDERQQLDLHQRLVIVRWLVLNHLHGAIEFVSRAGATGRHGRGLMAQRRAGEADDLLTLHHLTECALAQQLLHAKRLHHALALIRRSHAGGGNGGGAGLQLLAVDVRIIPANKQTE